MISTKTTVHSNLEGAKRNISIKNKNFAGERESLSYRIGISVEFSTERSVKRVPHSKSFTKGCIEFDSSSIRFIGSELQYKLRSKRCQTKFDIKFIFSDTLIASAGKNACCHINFFSVTFRS